ncbi:LANO_0F11210g1_1 [Lachancea nothofagi CBS 11611]|uniref:Guanine-nucleotide exchange factor YEL1 n=1 Tax=Lachancea nothofagi CBS 11611 TaxID=1266666 RepID=A0A1G4KAR5_9SACH|nr:LANO_0F11210g1_1 [Lachancea nothofagi CBS 11611]
MFQITFLYRSKPNVRLIAIHSTSHRPIDITMDSEIALDCVADKRLPSEDATLTESPKITNIHEIVSDTPSAPEARQKALKILTGKLENVDFKEYANFLGSSENAAVLKEFLLLLHPLPSSLTGTLRKLSSNIYFIAEAANIDTILEALAKQWLEAHSMPHYQNNYRLCHIVMFALLMLNSTLHNIVADCRFTLQEFEENTIHALQKECAEIDVPCFERDLKKCYISLDNQELPLLRPNNQPKHNLEKRSNTPAHGNNQNNMKKLSMLSMRGSSLERLHSHQSVVSCPTSLSTLTSRDTTATSNYRIRNNQPLQKLFLDEPFDEEMQDVNETPWLMDSVVKYQEAANTNSSTSQLLTPANTRKRKLFGWFKKPSKDTLFRENAHAAIDHNWFRARIRVYQGRLFLYKFKFAGTERTNGDPMRKWEIDSGRRNCSQFQVFNLYGTMASVVQENIVASENSNVNSVSLTLEFPHGIDTTSGLAFRFQTQNLEEAKMFTSCLNFWSARITPIPSAQAEMISNEEYGWSQRILKEGIDPKMVKLANWAPLVGLDALFAEMDENIALWDFDSHLQNLKVFTETLDAQLDAHNSLKPQMIKVLSKSSLKSEVPLFDKAMDNWNNKYLYLNQQYSKHLVYLKALQNAVEFHKNYEHCKSSGTLAEGDALEKNADQ